MIVGSDLPGQVGSVAGTVWNGMSDTPGLGPSRWDLLDRIVLEPRAATRLVTLALSRPWASMELSLRDEYGSTSRPGLR